MGELTALFVSPQTPSSSVINRIDHIDDRALTRAARILSDSGTTTTFLESSLSLWTDFVSSDVSRTMTLPLVEMFPSPAKSSQMTDNRCRSSLGSAAGGGNGGITSMVSSRLWLCIRGDGAALKVWDRFRRRAWQSSRATIRMISGIATQGTVMAAILAECDRDLVLSACCADSWKGALLGSGSASFWMVNRGAICNF
ncbi:hypothetical protein EJ03DRAFT_78105 [Teratosphaeria nubilosa]|uniref:Uncharacterized protein n=1 Tax=Teratosphaeria nubilosa TaxID=161662 RepID=A0A6G1LDN4_9PEZI|nr:hypothetical protein EJ03DRAFT_78105 [Teratosphaeria nubilosa]